VTKGSRICPPSNPAPFAFRSASFAVVQGHDAIIVGRDGGSRSAAPGRRKRPFPVTPQWQKKNRKKRHRRSARSGLRGSWRLLPAPAPFGAARFEDGVEEHGWQPMAEIRPLLQTITDPRLLL